MRIVATVLSLPIADPQRSLRFYRDGLGLETPGIEEGILAFELPNLSLFLIATDEYAAYASRAGVPGVRPVSGACIISCAIGTRAELDDILARATAAGGAVPHPATEQDGSYMGYFSDPDGHVWELSSNAHTAAAAAR
ncbi:VOC family protein [Nocardia puris]|uniref:VOC domain-containing protein n=1 Tax=Nocardia puris TaxID=208602 RepID=A0A366DVR2_9NOCA|nr:VOC family protein [Nocardia puris]MBF6210062.1 VOC family protein [Nocardia puris]MBF6368253.1 VOC family protein [Nocardia puris]MBF6458028.1 VOC family protein [Nocardia puris]RBO94190.1 hypothetical protein DFR74_102613 [Nocardia puris]